MHQRTSWIRILEVEVLGVGILIEAQRIIRPIAKEEGTSNRRSTSQTYCISAQLYSCLKEILWGVFPDSQVKKKAARLTYCLHVASLWILLCKLCAGIGTAFQAAIQPIEEAMHRMHIFKATHIGRPNPTSRHCHREYASLATFTVQSA